MAANDQTKTEIATTEFPPYRTITFELDEATHVATVTLNRPKALNAVTQTMVDEFADLWRRTRFDGRIYAVVLRANMESRAFSAGADVRGGEDGRDGFTSNPNVYSATGQVESLCPRMHQVWKPVICAVHGQCVGAALYWINDVDITICSDDALFFDPHVSLGITGAMSAIGMSRRVPLGDALRISLMGSAERVSAETALRIGLVSEITTRDNLWARANEIAETIASHNPIAVQGTVKAVWESLERGRKASLEQGLVYSAVTRAYSTGGGFDRADQVRKKGFTVR